MGIPLRPLESLETLGGYRQRFMDPQVWRPFVEEACLRNRITCKTVRPGLAGTFPTFIVDDRRVIKFFGPLFDGETCWHVEAEAARLMEAVPEFPVAQVLAGGSLETETDWHYLVFSFVPGRSIGEVYQQMPFEERLILAGWLGKVVHQMHRIKIPDATSLPRLSEKRLRGWFAIRWPGNQSKWPIQLASQVEDYLNANAAFLQADAVAFIHSDLTRDHLLGRLENGHWETGAVIDFGDAQVGNIFYELAALHLDLFDADRRLLRAFLQAYGLPPGPDFTRQAMVTSLMHQFDVYGPLFEKLELRRIRTLDELAECLWQVN